VKIVDITRTKKGISGSENYILEANIKAKNIRYLYREISGFKTG
jgi:hypothetical protein